MHKSARKINVCVGIEKKLGNLVYTKAAPPSSPTTHTSAEAFMFVLLLFTMEMSPEHMVDSHAEVEKEITTTHMNGN